MSGEFEPNDSRNVTGTASTPDGRWTAQGKEPPLAGGQSPQAGAQQGGEGRQPHEGWSSQGQPTAQGGGGVGGSGGLSEDDADDTDSDEDDGGVEFTPDDELIRKVGDDGGAGGLSSEGAGESMENRNMGSESGAGGNTFTGPSGGQAGNSQAGFGGAGAGSGGAGGAGESLGQANESGWPGQQNSGTEASLQQQQQAGSLGEQIREHMRVVDAEGAQVGMVDAFENDQIKLTRSGSSDGQHHYLPLDRVAGIEGDMIRLHDSGDNVFGSNGS